MGKNFTSVDDIDQMMLFIDENIEYVKSIFAIFDKQGDGVIPIQSLHVIICTLGLELTEKHIDNLIQEVSPNGNKVIGFIDFLELMNKMWKVRENAIRQAFRMFDTDESGFIDEMKFTDAVEQLQAKSMNKMRSNCDFKYFYAGCGENVGRSGLNQQKQGA